MNNRKKTCSMTELCKIIAQEVYDANQDKLKELVYNIIATENYKDLKETIENASKSYDKWETIEDTLLSRELHEAIKCIALSHNRSYGAIKSRIRKHMAIE